MEVGWTFFMYNFTTFLQIPKTYHIHTSYNLLCNPIKPITRIDKQKVKEYIEDEG